MSALAGPDVARPVLSGACLVRAGYGAALICCPGRVIQLRTGVRPTRRVCAVARVLGARHLVQATISAARPARWLVAAGMAADLVHAASMVAMADLEPGLRAALLTDSAIESAFAALAGLVLAGGPAPDRAARSL